jgi:hypothetical protein
MSLGENTGERLEMLFDEYRDLMTELILSSADFFKGIDDISRPTVLKAKRSLHELFVNLDATMNLLKGAKA